MNTLLPYAIAAVSGAAILALGACAHGPDYVKPTSTTAKVSDAAPVQPLPDMQHPQRGDTPAPAPGAPAAAKARPAAPGVDG
ncbi:hypothetical protein GWC77_05245 [Paraburkholderia sp. NMBU_R16]|uniref:hypothetical protein n=1 Tax=Paraburkholderia sp. NMBU_R16 TaxID=2698676 RepID=UPI001564E090|nr:hypothetical protein [Paraburkholderia sp. NMBU_R16]NRO95343.1 hypothetical protein [Paraburkholderia sp. NMBU_R16]